MPNTAKTTLDNARFPELDGLRGWASLSVLLFHLFWEMFGLIHPGFRNPITAALMNGKMAVMIFFILSGEALSVAFWQRGLIRPVLRQAVKRYPRLTLPILASCFVTYLLMQAGLVASHDATGIIHREDWMGPWLGFAPDLLGMLKYSLFDVYVSHVDAASYNPFLWTMQVELAGSFGLFLCLILTKYLPRPVLMIGMIAAILFLLKADEACFFVGMLYGRLQARGVFDAYRADRRINAASWIVIVCALTGFAYLQIIDRAGQKASMALAFLLVLSFHSNKTIGIFLKLPVSQWLGRLSFPAYLLQFAVIIGVASPLIVAADHRGMLEGGTVWAIAAISLLAVLLASLAFKPVERVTQALCDFLGRSLVPAEPILSDGAAALEKP